MILWVKMMFTFSRLLVVLVVSVLTLGLVDASDLAKEQRWREQVSDFLVDGEPIDLNDGVIDFFAIYTDAEELVDTAVIVIHGSGVHPDWSQVVQPIRVELAYAGWNTLSIQMPILKNDASIEDYIPLFPEVPRRIDAARRYLTEAGAKKVVLVAHSLGARMTNYYLSRETVANEENAAAPIVGYIGIGMGKGNDAYLEKINVPILDLYGSEDLPGVLETVDERAEAASHNTAYQQQMVDGANHFFDDQNEALLEAVTAALESF